MTTLFSRARVLLSALLAALLVGCGAPTGLGAGGTVTPPAPTIAGGVATAAPPPTDSGAGAPALGRPFGLTIGRPATVADLAIELIAVSEDSRCPRMVSCVWSGRASLSIALQAAGQARETRTLATISGPEKTDRLSYAGYEVRLVDLTPLRNHPEDAIAQSDYVAQILVTRR